MNNKKQLIQEALKNKEGTLANNESLVVYTGKRTGRSPKDKFIVYDESTRETVEWNSVNQKISTEAFDLLWLKAKNYLSKTKTYNGFFVAGQHIKHQINVAATTDLAWHMLFLTNLLIEKTSSEDSWELLVAAKLHLDPTKDNTNTDGIVALNFKDKKILIVGIEYSGEIKKSIFSVMNYLLTDSNVLSMHCAANEGAKGDVALFFGLSGTGKTTLSADPKRKLIGDDEHAWCDDGIFNIENGCYAKCFGLSFENEPLIFNAIKEFTILENVILDEDKKPIFDDASLTLNTRAAYPLAYINEIDNFKKNNHPTNIFMLTCDLFGVLPAISKLTIDQSLFWFLLGYTTHMGSTEYGESGIKPTFSTCFGAPFFPRNPEIYANLLKEKIEKTKSNVYLVNTGYVGGDYLTTGKRYSIQTTRDLIDFALSGVSNNTVSQQGPFGLILPQFYNQHPMKYWEEPELYIKSKEKLKKYIIENFIKLPLSEKLMKHLITHGFET